MVVVVDCVTRVVLEVAVMVSVVIDGDGRWWR